MTFTIRVRGALTGTTVAEYLCKFCGRFERVVNRDSKGDPPASVKCESVDDTGQFVCGQWSPHVISAPLYKPKITSVTTGKADPRPPGFLDTRELGEGMPMHEWRKKRAALREERRKKKVMEYKRS